MAQMDWEKERQRLSAWYGRMEDGELEKVAADLAALTEVAKQVLFFEMSKRRMTRPVVTVANQVEQGDEIEGRRPVILRRYRDLPEASIAKSVLESAGIDCFLSDDNMIRLDWFLSNLVGGIKLLVQKDDAEAATRLLEQAVPENFDVEGVGAYEQPHCPNCGSMDISLDGLIKSLTFGAMFITRLPIPITDKGWKCHACGHKWSEDGNIASANSTPDDGAR
jgi:hypothetical protein